MIFILGCLRKCRSQNWEPLLLCTCFSHISWTHHQTVCGCCFLKLWHSVLRSESITQLETEQSECIIHGCSSKGFSCCFRKVVIPRCFDTKRCSLILATIKPPWMLNDTEPVYLELEDTLWCTRGQYCQEFKPLKSLQNYAVTQISVTLCWLCSERQRACAAVAQRLFSALLTKALISKLFP